MQASGELGVRLVWKGGLLRPMSVRIEVFVGDAHLLAEPSPVLDCLFE